MVSERESRPIFGVDIDRKPIPKWVPVSLLAVSTVALAFPVIMLRRHRAATLCKTLSNSPPPPRRTTSLKGAPITNPTTTQPVFSIRDPLPSSSSSPSRSSTVKAEDGFNAPLQCLKAFSVATLLVGVGATATVWAVRQYMGVYTAQEFADQLRAAILTRMPQLSARIHRPPKPEDGNAPASSDPHSSAAMFSSLPDASEPWTWPAAERRLKEAFEKHGFYGWIAAAMQELEAEGRIERTKRGHV